MTLFSRGEAAPEWLQDAWDEMKGREFLFIYKHDNKRGGFGMWVDANAYCITFANVTLIDGISRGSADVHIVKHEDIEALQPYVRGMTPAPTGD